MALDTDRENAKCLSNSQETAQFQEYIKSCRTTNDNRLASTFLAGIIERYVSFFEQYSSQYTDLMISADGLSTLTGNTNAINDQVNNLQSQKEKINKKIEHYRRISNSADKSFIEDIYNGSPQKELAPSLQDVALIVFWFGWLIMSIVLVAVRTASGGGWRAGLFTAVLLLLVSVCVFAILAQVA